MLIPVLFFYCIRRQEIISVIDKERLYANTSSRTEQYFDVYCHTKNYTDGSCALIIGNIGWNLCGIILSCMFPAILAVSWGIAIDSTLVCECIPCTLQVLASIQYCMYKLLHKCCSGGMVDALPSPIDTAHQVTNPLALKA